MTNVLPFPSILRDAATMLRPAAVFALDDDDEIAVQLWELVMSGQRGSKEYQRLETIRSRRLSLSDGARPTLTR